MVSNDKGSYRVAKTMMDDRLYNHINRIDRERNLFLIRFSVYQPGFCLIEVKKGTHWPG